MLHFVDLFCGIGGASTGARDAGARVCLAVDLDQDALRVHAQNHPDCVHLHGALSEIETRVVAALPPRPRHIHASPPCQAFSQANQASDAAAQGCARALVEWAIHFCRKHGDTWSLEQVPTPEVRGILDALSIPFTVFDMSHFDVPQARKRIIASSHEVLSELHAVRDSNRPRVRVRDAIRKCRGTHIKNATTYTYATRDGARTRIQLTRAHPKYSRSIDEVAYTVTSCSPLRWVTDDDASRHVVMSPRELALLQSFPETYALDARNTVARRHVGNALPPRFMQHVVACVLKVASRRSAAEESSP